MHLDLPVYTSKKVKQSPPSGRLRGLQINSIQGLLSSGKVFFSFNPHKEPIFKASR